MSLKLNLQDQDQDALSTPYTPFTPREFKYDFHDHKTNKNRNNMKETNNLTLSIRMISELMVPRERNLLYIAILLAFCCSILRLISFIFIGAIIDVISNTYNSDNYTFHSIICGFDSIINCEQHTSLINLFMTGLIILSLLLSLIYLFQSLCVTYCVNSLLKRLNCLTFNCIIDKNLSYFDCTEIRDLRYLLTKDMKYVNKAIHKIIIVIQSFILFMACIIYIFIYKWDIAAIFSLGFMLIMIISFIFFIKYRSVQTIRTNSFKIVVLQIIEMLNYITTIKTFSKENDEKFLYKLGIDNAFNYDKNKNIFLCVYECSVYIISYGTILSVIWYGSYTYSAGVLLLNLLILIQLNLSLYQIVTLLFLNRINFNSIERILNTLSRRQNNYNPDLFVAHKIIKENIIGLVEMKNIQFSYENRRRLHNKFVFNDISLRFEPYCISALIGNMASGKQSIFKLLMKFYDIKSGEILIDNININQYNLSFLHSKIGYISFENENISLFKNRSIRDNITFGMKLDRSKQESVECDALQLDILDNKYFDETHLYFWREFKGKMTQNEIENVCRIANIHSFIVNLQNGYDTIIGGANGIKLSENEKKRVCIARAILSNPKILLLNESIFIGSEPISKYLMQNTLDNILNKEKCTVLIIANTLKTLKKANMIYVFDNGQIIQHGKHEELIQNIDGHYFKIAQSIK